MVEKIDVMEKKLDEKIDALDKKTTLIDGRVRDLENHMGKIGGDESYMEQSRTGLILNDRFSEHNREHEIEDQSKDQDAAQDDEDEENRNAEDEEEKKEAEEKNKKKAEEKKEAEKNKKKKEEEEKKKKEKKDKAVDIENVLPTGSKQSRILSTHVTTPYHAAKPEKVQRRE